MKLPRRQFLHPDEQKLAVGALLASQHMRFTIDKAAIPYVAE
jgi:hypothetical protein